MIADLLLPAALAFIMFSVGLSLETDDFRRLAIRPGRFVAGLAGQLVMVPAAAVAVAIVAGLPPALALGLLILAACPGGASSAFLTQLARGNVALSLSLTLVSSVAALLTFPLLVKGLFVHLGGAAFAEGSVVLGELPVGGLIGSVLVVTTLPTLMGMIVRRRAGRIAERAQRSVGRLATGFFAAIVAVTFFAHHGTIVSQLATVGPATLFLNALAMAGGYGAVALAGGERADSVAGAMECGLQNAGLGIFVSITLLGRPEVAVPSVIYALTMNAGAVVLVLLSRAGGMRRGAVTG